MAIALKLNSWIIVDTRNSQTSGKEEMLLEKSGRKSYTGKQIEETEKLLMISFFKKKNKYYIIEEFSDC